MSCYNCVFHSVYRDMSASCDVCTLHSDLVKAIKACVDSKNCPYHFTHKEAKEYIYSKVKEHKNGSSD